ncbi:DUF5605 domain-containing protein [Cohnella thailandensis]|uniref:DUF5605 domain-containing protein n=1 Tax=Cohnella thailandensis TaxID=557557 RepID=A0A841T0U0_9BACL|nr:DUF5605 domain-containing protein [Cohnella thailandensis]MBB6637784.1 DUF5605 domain-containing protein [Cohnella thailandensis]MBP1974038.1 hypothetical protein [Cohnella thailandensis]
MAFRETDKFGHVLKNPESRAILFKNDPSLASSDYLLQFRKLGTFGSYLEALPSEEAKEALLRELEPLHPLGEPEEKAPSADYEDASVARGSAAARSPGEVERWGMFQLSLEGPSHGNPFVDVGLSADFSDGERTLRALGFYDGEGRYLVRFMPDREGEWTFRTSSNARSLDGIEGRFAVTAPAEGNHGPVRVKNTFHFAYEDGTPYYPVGTTCYVWTHQGNELEEQTLRTLAKAPFNKMRMCVFPKAYLYNENEPELYPYEGSREQGWDYSRFNPAFFRHLENRIAQLGELGIEADLILFHAYDRWGFSEMGKVADDRYLRYVTARLSAFRHIWWSLANEYDLMWEKETDDWERFAGIVTGNDPHGHLISIHNCNPFYDYSRPWVTHCSIQRQDVYRTAEYTDEWRAKWNKPVVIDECAYEGNVETGWGNISGQEMTRRFWEGAVRGGYVGHGETYLHPQDILWWAKGGELHGTSPDRIAFLRRILEEGPEGGINPLKKTQMDWDVPIGGVPGEYLLYYFGFNRPSFRVFHLEPGTRYTADVIDTWNMTIERLEGTYEGTFRIELTGREYMAVRFMKAQ